MIYGNFSQMNSLIPKGIKYCSLLHCKKITSVKNSGWFGREDFNFYLDLKNISKVTF
jgi:hypothetical protein